MTAQKITLSPSDHQNLGKYLHFGKTLHFSNKVAQGRKALRYWKNGRLSCVALLDVRGDVFVHEGPIDQHSIGYILAVFVSNRGRRRWQQL